MKNLIKSTVALLVFIFSGTVSAQTAFPKLENSLLWEVSGNGLSKPSYVYGTTHMICTSDYFLSEKTKKKFDASDKLVMEVDFSDPNEMKYAEQMAMGKKPLTETLNADELSKLDQVLKKNAGLTIQQVNAYSMMSVMSLISFKSFGCNDIKMYEIEFMNEAKKKNRPIGGFETFKSQEISAANAYSNLELIAMLDESTVEESAKFISDYKNENLEALYVSNTREKVMNAKAKKYMLDDRNANWVLQMPEMMKNESVFFAVGAAHLAGDLGVIYLLKKAGYNVKPVMN